MYCVKCGVSLADTEKKCPLCSTVVYHPEVKQGEGEELFPTGHLPESRSSKLGQLTVTVFHLVAIGTVLFYDLRFSGRVSRAGYVIGGILTGYVSFVLPTWFRRPNPVIFFPCAMATVCLYLLYIDLATGGKWFLSFAFPVTGGIALIITAAIVLLKYVKRGKLYIVGGTSIALGGFMLLVEFLMSVTFKSVSFIGWCFFPIIALGILGGFLIFLALCPPLRESVERRVFF